MAFQSMYANKQGMTKKSGAVWKRVPDSPAKGEKY